MNTSASFQANTGLYATTSTGSYTAPSPSPRLWSADAWHALAARIVSMAKGGGETRLNFDTMWSGNVRWARNRVNTSGDQRNNTLTIGRSIRSDRGQFITINQLDTPAVAAAMSYAEEAIQQYQRESLTEFREPPFQSEDYLHPTLWFPTTDQLDGAQRAAAARQAILPAEQAGMLSAGYIAVTASGVAVERTGLAMQLYYPVTEAQYSVTVRDPDGTASGWAGVNWNDWARIDVAKLSAIALDKCLRSRNPVTIEPGRYTAILEPQATYDFINVMMWRSILSWPGALSDGNNPYVDATKAIGTKLGERLIDSRLTIRADPMDPDLGFVPFDANGEPYRPAVWFDRGVLTHLAYNRRFAVDQGLGNVGLLNSENFRLDGSGSLTTVDEMIASTKRGLLVTRFSHMRLVDMRSLLQSGYTRDGLWLIENGKVSHAVKNLRFTESPLFALNKIEAIGTAQRVFCPGNAAIVPPLKIMDFSFTSLSDAV